MFHVSSSGVVLCQVEGSGTKRRLKQQCFIRRRSVLLGVLVLRWDGSRGVSIEELELL